MSKKKQHYLPQFILRNWCREMQIPCRNNMIYKIDSVRLNRYTNNIRNCFQKKNLYEFTSIEKYSNYIENQLSHCEQKWAPIIKKLINGNELTESEFYVFCFFILVQLVRTPYAINNLIPLEKKFNLNSSEIDDRDALLLHFLDCTQEDNNEIQFALYQKILDSSITIYHSNKSRFIINEEYPIFGNKTMNLTIIPLHPKCFIAIVFNNPNGEVEFKHKYHIDDLFNILNKYNLGINSRFYYTCDVKQAQQIVDYFKHE